MAIGSIPRLLLIEDSARFARALISAAADRYEIVAVQSAEEVHPQASRDVRESP